MRLVQVLSIVLTELGIGGLIMTSLLPPRQVRLSFFTLNSLISCLAIATALLLTKYVAQETWWDVRFLGLTVIGGTAAFGCFRLEKPEVGRLFLVASALVGLVFGLLPLAEPSISKLAKNDVERFVLVASPVAGALLMGAANVGMILGHWYLLDRRMPFDYLERFAELLLGALGLRGLVFITAIYMFSVRGQVFFTVMRVLWGLALPAVLGVMALRCVREKANQAATGLLYVIAVSVLFGELFAGYLMF